MNETGFPEGPHIETNTILTGGMILDGRYEIIRVLGEGGFGVTYEAVNLHTGFRTAIKEHKEGNHEKILQEARVLRDFSDDPAVVTVLDSFYENGRSYLVMEYLDGITLASEIKLNGKWNSETAVRRFVPVMKALERMHNAGVIHRDISPDNLMLMPDGSLVLMDFGSAKDISLNNFTQTSIYKSVYSSPEQRDANAQLGTYTDIYALCATLYFCITGMEPEDAYSRLLYDELKKPSEIGADILPRAEKALMKGMELDWEDRIQKTEELRQELEEVYPALSEEEKKTALERQKRRKRAVRTFCILSVIAVLALLYVFRVRIRFLSIETQRVALNGEELSDSGFRSQTDGVKKRLKAFAGKDNFLWKENGKMVLFEVPADLFGDSIPQDFVRAALTRPMVLSVYPSDSPEDAITLLQTEDIESVVRDAEGMRVTFSGNAAERLSDILKTRDAALIFAFDLEAGYDTSVTYTGSTPGDGKSVLLGDPYPDTFPVPDALLIEHLTEKPLDNFFRVQSEWKTRWENPDQALFPGKNQYKPEEIPGETISVKYSRLRSVADKTIHAGSYNGSEFSSQAIIKNRLDSLGAPYAIGIDLYDSDTYVIKLPIESVCMEELRLLGVNHISHSFYLGSQYAFSSKCHGSFTAEAAQDNVLLIRFSDTGADEAEKMLNVIERQGGEKIYIYYNDTKIAGCSLVSAKTALHENRMIPFEMETYIVKFPKDIWAASFSRFIAEGIDQNLGIQYSLNDPLYEVRNSAGKIIFFNYQDMLPDYATADQHLTDLSVRWKEEYKGRINFSLLNSDGLKGLHLAFPERDLNDPENALSDFVLFYQKYREELTDGNLQSIDLTISSKDNTSDAVNIILSMSFESGKLEISSSFLDDPLASLWIYGKNQEAFKTYILESPWWRPMLEESLNTAEEK